MKPLIKIVSMDDKFDHYSSTLLSNKQNTIRWNDDYTAVTIKNKSWCVFIRMNDDSNTATILSTKNAPEYKW